MNRRTMLVSAIALCGFGGFGLQSATGQPGTRPSVQSLLAQNIDVPTPFQEAPVPFKIVLGYLTEKLAARGLDLEFAVDFPSFRDADPKLVDTLSDDPITFSKFTAKLTVRQYLDLAVQQLPGDASYIVRGGLVVVAPAKSLKLDRLLHRRITIDLRGKSVVEALEAVADLSGVSIVVDRRCSDAPAALVELRTNNDMSVRGILESIADTHDLKIIVDAHRVTVMPQTAYLKRLRDQAEEAAALRGIEK